MTGSLAHVTIPSTGPPATYDNADRLVSLGGQTFSYDDNGNLTSDGVRGYTWNARNQLASVTGPGLAASFSYDGGGRRSSKTVNGQTTNYLYDGPNLVQEQVGGTPSVSRLTTGLDQTLLRTDASGTRAPITDALGSVVGLVDGTGTVTTQYTYDPYGNPTTTGEPSGNTQQFTGRDFDAETGLLYNRARYYSPALARFISQDPSGFAGGSTNLYSYALSDPVNLTDPNGDCPVCAAVAAGCVAGGLINVGLGWGLSKLLDRKYSWGDAARDFGIGCALGALTEGIGAALTRGAVAGAGEGGAAIGATGQIGEDFLRALGGQSQVRFNTTTGPRIVDQLVNNIAHESKVGYQALTSSIARQIAKDVELMQTGRVDAVTWDFFKSPVTGLVGPSEPLRQALQQAGITIVIH